VTCLDFVKAKEITMLYAAYQDLAKESVSAHLNNFLNKSNPYGGRGIILGRNFRQLVPVVPHALSTAVIQNSINFQSFIAVF